MVNLIDVTVPRAQSNKQRSSTINANPNTKRTRQRVVVRKEPVSSTANEDEENDELPGAHKFENSHLIMTLAAWVKKPSVDHDLCNVLAKYRVVFNNSQNPNFVEAALIIQEAGKLYEKKVDLLYKSILLAQHRITKSFNIINIEELHKIEKKMGKRKLTQVPDHQLAISKRRKKPNSWLNSPWLGQLIRQVRQIIQEHVPIDSKEQDNATDIFHIAPEILKPMEKTLAKVEKETSPEAINDWKEAYFKAYEKRFIPIEEYIYIPTFQESKFIAYESPEGDQIVHWETLLMSQHNFYLMKKIKWFHVYIENEDPKTIMDASVWDDGWYKHRMANLEAPNLLELFNNYDKYDDSLAEQFLMEKLDETYMAQLKAETLKNKNKRLCPFQLKVVATPIPAVAMQSLLERQRFEFLSEPVASTTRDTPEESIDNNNETVAVLVLSDPNNSNAENQMIIFPQTPEEMDVTQENVPALPEGSNSGNCLEVPQITDVSLTVLSIIDVGLEVPPSIADVDSNNETIVEDHGIDGLGAKDSRAVLTDVVPIERRMSKRERKLTKFKPNDDDDDEIESIPKRKKRFKLQITTTVNFLDYERFFLNNYTTEEREGILRSLSSAEESAAVDLNNEDGHTAPAVEDEEVPQSHIPRLPTEKIITPQMRRFDELQAIVAKNIEKRRWYFDWEKMIRARLREQVEGPQFDIHEYGSRIVNQFLKNEPGNTIKFKDLVMNQSKREAARNFVAALHLATSMNLEMSGTTPGRLSNETLELKLLSGELHHETLMEFEATSELSSNRVRSQNGKVRKQTEGSTFVIEEVVHRPITEPVVKKPRIQNRTPKRVNRFAKSNKLKTHQMLPVLSKKIITEKHVPTLLLNNCTTEENMDDKINKIQQRYLSSRELSPVAQNGNSNLPQVLNHTLTFNNSKTCESAEDSSNLLSSNSKLIVNLTINNKLINIQSLSSNNQDRPAQSQSAKTPAKSVSFSKADSVVRCTTTIMKSPTSFILNQPAATSTPFSSRSQMRQSFDSGFSTDSTSSSNKIRRLTIDESMHDIDMLIAGPSTDYSKNYPASFELDDSAVSGDVNAQLNSGKYRDRESRRKRHLDFNTM